MGLRRAVGAILDVVDKQDRVRRLRARLREDWTERWLRVTANLIHVGANTGQERDLYARHGVGVLWVEPLQEPFDALCRNISKYPKQRAIKALLADVSGRVFTLNVATNDGASSSILDPLDVHTELWPSIHFNGTATMSSRTLDDVLDEEHRPYDALVMDTQGAELKILMGATRHLRDFRFIKAEAADFELYRGYPMAAEIIGFLEKHGFEVSRKTVFATRASGGECFDLLFERAH